MHLNDFSILRSNWPWCNVFTKETLYNWHYGFFLVSLIVQYFGVTTFHFFSVFTMCSPDWYMSISSWYNTKCIEILSQMYDIFTVMSSVSSSNNNNNNYWQWEEGFLMFFLQLAESLWYRVLLELSLSW